MINISKLYCDQVTPGDWLRYGRKGSGEREGEIVPRKASERRPIVVWNISRACNLKCVHCYNDSGASKADDELSTDEAKVVLDDLVQFGVHIIGSSLQALDPLQSMLYKPLRGAIRHIDQQKRSADAGRRSHGKLVIHHLLVRVTSLNHRRNAQGLA